MARKIILRQIRELKSLRKFSTTVFLKNKDYIIKSPLTDIVIPKMRFLDRLWINFPAFQDHVAIVSLYFFLIRCEMN